MSEQPKPSEIILDQTSDGRTRLDVRVEGETAWLTQKQLAELFDKDVRTVNEDTSASLLSGNSRRIQLPVNSG